jgi:hypothetical protein
LPTSICAADYDYNDYGDYYTSPSEVAPTSPPVDVANYGLNCEFEGKTYADGESFEPEACTRCTCFQGVVNCERDLCSENTCAGVLCPEIECENKYVPLGQCCPVCPGGLIVKISSFFLIVVLFLSFSVVLADGSDVHRNFDVQTTTMKRMAPMTMNRTKNIHMKIM